jgi:hypothetical protein
MEQVNLDDVPTRDKPHLIAFQKELCQAVVDRFTNDKEKGEKVFDKEGKARRIVTADIFHNKNYILASLLDPRIKDVPFLGNNYHLTAAAVLN